jgi:hypothetical protein
MAYAITLNNNLLRIAANETEKNELTAINTSHSTIDISDSDFIKFKVGVDLLLLMEILLHFLIIQILEKLQMQRL